MRALLPVYQLGTNNYSISAIIIRNKLKVHISAEGAIAFQYKQIG